MFACITLQYLRKDAEETDNVCCLQGEEERQLENWEEDIFWGGHLNINYVKY